MSIRQHGAFGGVDRFDRLAPGVDQLLLGRFADEDALKFDRLEYLR